jgi:hypothetical protein
MYVIGLTGAPQHGKSTVGRLLRNQAGADRSVDLEYSDLMIAVANLWLSSLPEQLKQPATIDPVARANAWIALLPPALEQTTGKSMDSQSLLIRSDDHASKNLHRPLIEYTSRLRPPNRITRSNKIEHRSLLQWLGARMRILVSETIWSDLVEAELDKLNALSYQLVTVGGIRSRHETVPIWRRDGIVIRVVRAQSTTNSDPAETADVPYDIELHNDDGLERLKTTVETLWKHLLEGRLEDCNPQPRQYFASVSSCLTEATHPIPGFLEAHQFHRHEH